LHDLVALAAAGFGLGLLHSFEPDHLAAMSTLVARTPGRAARELGKGATWALGHTLALGACGGLLALAGARLPDASARPLEALVGAVLVYLGFVRLRDARRGPHRHRHAHGALEHEHVHLHARRSPGHAEAAHARHGHGPLWLGVLHGLAGSGSLLVLVPALVIESPAAWAAWVAAFGLGSAASMGAFCSVLGGFAAWLEARSRRAGPWLAAATGSLSLSLGGVWLVAAFLA
jgi:sulfite exporter TauE/SafE